jgi:threonine/homoserine/homoserine lactone efflux protein
MSTYLAFAAIAALLVLSPGPNLFLLLKNTPMRGQTVGLLNVLGMALAILCHATLSLAGLSALVVASSTAFAVIKLLGAAYLVYLGLMALREAWRGSRVAATIDVASTPVATHARSAVAEGWLTNILNPKPSMFYLAAFPQFLDPSGSIIVEGLTLGCLHAAMALMWYGFVVVAVDKVRATLSRPVVARVVKAVSGTILIAFGVRLAQIRTPA